MSGKGHIPQYDSIAALHQASGMQLASPLADFHVFRLEDTYPHVRPYMPPFRRGFFQVNFLRPDADTQFSLGGTLFRVHAPLLYFVGPAQVYSWRRGLAMRGFVLYFTQGFAHLLAQPVAQVFPSFQPWQPNLAQPAPDAVQQLQHEFEQLLLDQATPQPYRRERLQHGTLRLLYLCKGLMAPQVAQPAVNGSAGHLAHRFAQLVEQQYLTHHAVQTYADQLAVTPGYLSEAVKAAFGQTPKQLIEARLMLEARQLLQHTQLASAEIAYRLGYADPAQFGKRFRLHVGLTPNQFRQDAPVAQP